MKTGASNNPASRLTTDAATSQTAWSFKNAINDEIIILFIRRAQFDFATHNARNNTSLQMLEGEG